MFYFSIGYHYLDSTPQRVSDNVNYRTETAQSIVSFVDSMFDIIVPVSSNLSSYSLRDVENDIMTGKRKESDI